MTLSSSVCLLVLLYLVVCFTYFRNQGVLTSEVKFDLHKGEDKQLRYTMECGKHKATVFGVV